MYQGGALRAQVEIRTAEQKQAVAEYARAGAARVRRGRERARRPRRRCASAKRSSGRRSRDSERALELAQIQYRVGSVDLRAVEQSQLALYSARISLLRVQTERLAQRVNLHLALGGGFDLPPMEPVAAQ